MILDYQEARRAAKKAYDVTKVDQRVNRAVAAANKAANAARIATVKAIQKQIQKKIKLNKSLKLGFDFISNLSHLFLYKLGEF